MIGLLHSIETMGLVDGPGTRTIFFLQGCPLRCAYCHNPDTQKKTGGQEVTPQRILEIARRYRSYYGEEGGVTFS
ncbi:MAG TPA: 4Fe-4S cluster-binding domain-containing protein, partial [Bacillota bacterium]|nr:4Fe-4S cluster-binding domain-containing protein [Bacillota bacterium]